MQGIHEPVAGSAYATSASAWTTAWPRLRRLAAGAPGDWLLASCVALAALLLDLYRLAGTSLYFDEAMSAGLALQPWPVVWRYLWGPEDHMIFYYVVLHLWVQLTSALGLTPSEFILRAPSVAFAAGSVAVIYLLTRRFWGRSAALVAAGLYLLNPLQLFHAQKARSYSLQMLLLCLAWFALYAILSGAPRQRRWWGLFGVSMVLAIYSQPFSALVLAAQIAAFALYRFVPGPWRARATGAWRAAAIALAAIALACLPEGVNVLLHGQSNEWVPPAGIQAAFDTVLIFAGNDPVFLTALALAGALGICAVVGPRVPALAQLGARGGALGQLRDALARWIARVPAGILGIACWLVLPFVLSFLGTQGSLNLHLFWWRYLIAVVPPLCILASIGVAALRLPLARLGVGLLLLLLAAVQANAYYPTAQLSDWRSPAAWVQQHYHSGDGMVCISGLLCSIPMQYYLRVSPGSASFPTDAPGNWNWPAVRGNAYDAVTIERYVALHPRTFFITTQYGPSAADLAEARQEQAWLNSHYQLVGQYTAQNVAVRLYAAPAVGAAQTSEPTIGGMGGSMIAMSLGATAPDGARGP